MNDFGYDGSFHNKMKTSWALPIKQTHGFFVLEKKTFWILTVLK